MNDEIFELTDFLEGNINRMCVTDDENELLSMYNFALSRISKLFEIRCLELHVENQTEIPVKY